MNLKTVFWPETQKQLKELLSILKKNQKNYSFYNPPLFPEIYHEILIDIRALNGINHQKQEVLFVEPGISLPLIQQQLLRHNKILNMTHPWLHLRSITTEQNHYPIDPRTPLLERIKPLYSGEQITQIGIKTYRKNNMTRSLFFFKDLECALKSSSEMLQERVLFIEIMNPVVAFLLDSKSPTIPDLIKPLMSYLSETAFSHIIFKKMMKKLPALINYFHKDPLYPMLVTYQKDSEIDNLLPSSYDLFSELTPDKVAAGFQFKKLPLLYYGGKELSFSISFPTNQGINFIEHIDQTFGDRFINLQRIIPVTPTDLICNLTLISPLAPSQQKEIYQRIENDIKIFSGTLLTEEYNIKI